MIEHKKVEDKFDYDVGPSAQIYVGKDWYVVVWAQWLQKGV